MDSKLSKISKKLSYVLRHAAEEVGIPIRPDGYVRVQDLLEHPLFSGITLPILIQIVENNDKKRFEFSTISDEMYIRACQGHTIEAIQEKDLLTPIVDASLFPTVFHGTYEKFLPMILENGLSRMKRNHIHMATSMNPNSVVSGVRKNAEVYIKVDIAKALKAGIPFFISNNGVILSPGLSETGIIPSEFFETIIR